MAKPLSDFVFSPAKGSCRRLGPAGAGAAVALSSNWDCHVLPSLAYVRTEGGANHVCVDLIGNGKMTR
jgi:hypothetical protein